MGIDYRRFAAGNGEALRARRDPQKLVLLFVGRLVEKKGVADLLTAITCLSKDVVERIELWIIGHGTEFDRLTVMAVEYGIKDKVVFYGRLPNEQLPDFYAAADIFIAPSIIDADGDTEGQGVIFLEAMASGIPVIGTRTGGVAEMIDHGNTGLLVAPNHVDQLAAAIERLIADEPFRAKLGEAGQRVAECHDWQLLATKFIALYLSVVDNQRR
jgi:glycosyltransferase involved in cell wall biosynthesis